MRSLFTALLSFFGSNNQQDGIALDDKRRYEMIQHEMHNAGA